VLLSAIDGMRAEDRGGWTGSARRTRAEELGAAVQVLTGAWIEAIADADRDKSWAAAGFTSTSSWLAHRCLVTQAEAQRRSAASKLLREEERTAKAFAAGDLPVGSLDTLARVRSTRAARYHEDEEELLDLATQETPAAFTAHARQWVQTVDDRYTPEELDGGGSWLHASRTFGGCVAIDALLDPDDGIEFLKTLDAAMRPPASDDTRPARERRAEAFMGIVRGEARPTVAIDAIVDINTLNGEPVSLADARCEIVGIGPIAPSIMRRLACDCAAGRVLTHGSSLPLDVGRRTRLISTALLRALTVRDRGCRYRGCHRPASWCDAHHIVAWHKGGATDLDNLVLLCRAHHTYSHRNEHEMHVERHLDGTIEVFALPP